MNIGIQLLGNISTDQIMHEQFNILQKCRGKLECLILWNAIDQGKETNFEHASRLHPCETV